MFGASDAGQFGGKKNMAVTTFNVVFILRKKQCAG